MFSGIKPYFAERINILSAISFAKEKAS